MKTGRKIIHGHHTRINGRTKEWIAWDHMKRRCNNPNNANFKYYGAKGIKVCKEWLESFQAFLRDVGLAPSPKHSLDRHPNKNGNYEQGNVRWATEKEQQRNRTDNTMVEINGETKVLAEWSEINGIRASTISDRIKRGVSGADLLKKIKRGRNSNLSLK